MTSEKENTEIKKADAGWYTLETARAAAAPYKYREAAEVFEPWDGCIMTGKSVNVLIKRAQAAIDAVVARINAKRKELYGKSSKEPLPIPRISVAQSIIDRREYKIQTTEHTFGWLKKYNVAPLTQEMLTRFAQGEEETKLRDNARESAENETDNE